jgi:hypothetical protein
MGGRGGGLVEEVEGVEGSEGSQVRCAVCREGRCESGGKELKDRA